MHRIILITTLCALTLPIYPQYAIFIRSGPNYSILKQGRDSYYTWDSKYSLGGSLSLSVSRTISPRFSGNFDCGLDIQKSHVEGAYGSKFESHHLDGDLSMKLLKLCIVPRITLIKTINLDLITGFYASYLFKATVSGKLDGEDIFTTVESDFRGSDDGLMIGIGIIHSINNTLGVNLDMIYSHSISDLVFHSEHFNKQMFLCRLGLCLSIRPTN